MSRPLRAIVFDFDGVIANSEPLHLLAFQQALAEDGVELSATDYYAVSRLRRRGDVRGTGAGSRDVDAECACGGVGRAQGRSHAGPDALGIGALSRAHSNSSARRQRQCPSRSHPVRCATRSTRSSTRLVWLTSSPRSSRPAIPESKPSPAPYRLAFEQLRERTGRALDPRRSVAIEDSRWGLESARGAGLRLVGVTNSYSAGELSSAELVVNGLSALTLPALDKLCAS